MFFSAGILLAQINKNTVGIGGSLCWEREYWDDEEGTSAFQISPEISCFMLNNLSVLLNIQTVIYTYPKKWHGSPDLDLGFGIGSKYYFKYFYSGLSFQYRQWNKTDSKHYLLWEGGYLLSVKEHVFVDFGLDFLDGINKSAKQHSKIKTGIGIAIFL